MWILPKSLISAFAQGTEALTLDSVECSQICERSLMRRSKPSQSKTFLREWRVGNLMRLRSGAISSPSLGSSFLDWWTYSLAGSRASHSAVPASEPETKTSDTSSHTFWKELNDADLPLFSLRMLKESSPQNSQGTTGETQPGLRYCSMSLGSWSVWVTTQRQAYSARLNAARHTSESGSSSLPWPTPSQRDYKGACASRVTPEGYNSRLDEAVIVFGQADPDNHSTHGSRPELLWPTHTNTGAGRVSDGKRGRDLESYITNPQAWNRPESWLTPRANEPGADSNFVARMGDRGEHCHVSLTSQAKAWATPQAMDGNMTNNLRTDGRQQQLPNQVQAWGTPRTGIKAETHYSYDRGKHNIEEQAGASIQGGGKLNPRWVETLMGLPVGWTMPSCQSPATIAQTSCAYSATESSLPQQP